MGQERTSTFNFQALQWGLTYTEEEHYVLERPAPIKCGLRIFDKERTPDRSRWGPLDGTPDEEENPETTFKFGSDTGGDTPTLGSPLVETPKKKNKTCSPRPTHPCPYQ